MWELENVRIGVDALTVGLFTRVLGWSKLEVDVFLAQVLTEMKDTKLHAYWEM